MHSLKIASIVLIIFAVWSCSNGDRTTRNANRKVQRENSTGSKTVMKITVSPEEKEKFTIGESLDFKVELIDTATFDSARFFINGELVATSDSLPFQYKWDSKASKVGPVNFRTQLLKGKTLQSQSQSVLLLSDIIPEKQTFKTIKTHPHDIKAYTQGLFYHNGYLYEATGLKGESSLRKVNPETGDIFQSYTIPEDYFGEGITMLNNQIIQLTWQSHTGFVYNINDFRLLQTFNYPTQGWGITTIEDKLVMSDGTSTLYYLHGSSFGEIDRISVFDNVGQVAKLNELEYVDGNILANIYGDMKIARIDPKTGKVLAYIDLTGILQESDKHDQIDVLNGIAHDETNNRLFVTGKRWPKLYEIEIIPTVK